MRYRIAALVAGLATAGAMLAAPAASANTLATPSMGATNLISYADSDFEGSVGDWVNVANATLSDDTTQAFLHADSLKAVAGTTAAMQFKLGNAQQINVTAGDTYRVGSYFKAPALSSRTITLALGFFNASNTFLGWTSGSTITLNNSGGWQYVTSNITAPAGATYMLGSPRVTEGGQAASEALSMDEMQVAPLRPSLVQGADAGNGGAVSNWTSANTSIGPLQEDKIFYSGAVPAAYTGSVCAGLPANVVCMIAYKTQTTNLSTYISGIPASRAVVFVYHQEPENGDYTSGATFKTEFEGQSNAIRSDSSNAPNIFVAMDSTVAGYGTGNPGADCSYIVPASYTDFYLQDIYQVHPNGTSQPTGQNAAGYTNWLDCVETGMPSTAGTAPKPIGLAEFGYGASGGVNNCTLGSEANRATTMSADGSYFQGLPATINAPVDFWDYWWVDDSTAAQPCKDWNFPATSATNTNWQAFATQNGGGAN